VAVEKLLFLRKQPEIWEIENVYESGVRRLWGFLLQSFLADVLTSEFFNSHACLRQ